MLGMLVMRRRAAAVVYASAVARRGIASVASDSGRRQRDTLYRKGALYRSKIRKIRDVPILDSSATVGNDFALDLSHYVIVAPTFVLSE